jgi:IMP dehydrogenase
MVLGFPQENYMIREGLTFDDVLLVPQHSNIESRSKVDLTAYLEQEDFEHPIIPANMKSVIGQEMVYEIIQTGGLAILHRFMPLQEQLDIAEDIMDMGGMNRFAISLGVKDEDFQTVSKFVEIGVNKFCIDVAHGDSAQCINMIKRLRQFKGEKLFIIAGNVATGSGARRLWEAGADVVKVGVGPGSLCTTRIETGNGVPQLTALMEVAEVQRQLLELERTKYYPHEMNLRKKFSFIADGGIKNAGDIVKALCFADMVMVGNLFAGCEESPGKVLSVDGRSYKEYAGSSTHKTNHVEGVIALVPSKGSYHSILEKLLEGVRSGCSYQGSQNLAELRDNPEFIRITNAGLRESHPHDVVVR